MSSSGDDAEHVDEIVYKIDEEAARLANLALEARMMALPVLFPRDRCQHGCPFSRPHTCKRTDEGSCTCWHCDGRCLTSKFGGLRQCPYCVHPKASREASKLRDSCLSCRCCGLTHSDDATKMPPADLRKYHTDYDECKMCMEADEGNSHDSHHLCEYHTAHDEAGYLEESIMYRNAIGKNT